MNTQTSPEEIVSESYQYVARNYKNYQKACLRIMVEENRSVESVEDVVSAIKKLNLALAVFEIDIKKFLRKSS